MIIRNTASMEACNPGMRLANTSVSATAVRARTAATTQVTEPSLMAVLLAPMARYQAQPINKAHTGIPAKVPRQASAETPATTKSV
jgi:hypothetical protein